MILRSSAGQSNCLLSSRSYVRIVPGSPDNKMKYIKLLIFFFLILGLKKLQSENLEINCFLIRIKQKLHIKILKIIDLNVKEILEQKIQNMIELSHIVRMRLFFHSVYETYSVLDLTTLNWTIYSNSSIDIYKCR